ncbi:MAG: DUF3365 domain-containing protein [Acetobacteraceae bacterium]|nr:DUF3365 domain-containing protein [Acetobacteraceae bacterium]
MSTGRLVTRILLVIFLFSLLCGAGGFFVVLRQRALEAAAEKARLLLSTAHAVSDYTDERVFPLLDALPSDQFYDQIVPFHVVQAIFRKVQAENPAYSYREPALNPTNLNDRPTPFEVELTNRFRADPSLKDLHGIREEAGHDLFYRAEPIRVSSAECLVCHSHPDRAPKAMVARYGPVNGFGWSMGEIVGVQVLSIPVTEELRGTSELAVILAGGLVLVFLLTYITLMASLRVMLVRPLQALARAADVASRTSAPRADLQHSGVREINTLAAAIRRLRISLQKALALANARSPDPQ